MIDIRLATFDDIADIHTMICDLSAFHGDTAQVTHDQLRDMLFGPAPMATVLIATYNKSPVGYAGLTPIIIIHEGKLRLDIHHLFVKCGHRSRGVGTALIQAAKAHALQIGATRLLIGTDPDNSTAIAAYRAMPALNEITGAGPHFRIDLAQ